MRGYRYEVHMTSYVGFLGQDGFINEFGLWRLWGPCRVMVCRICIGFSSIEIEAF